jgi:hypothetical protein
MNIIAIFSKRTNKEFITSLEVVIEQQEGEPEFQTSFSTNPALFNVKTVTCSQSVYDTIKDLAGTREAPGLIADATAPKYEGRLNVYVQNGALKIA